MQKKNVQRPAGVIRNIHGYGLTYIWIGHVYGHTYGIYMDWQTDVGHKNV